MNTAHSLLFTRQALVEASGVLVEVFKDWRKRRLLGLDGSRAAASGEAREWMRFSLSDVVRVALVTELAAHGMSAGRAAAVITDARAAIDGLFREPRGSQLLYLVIGRDHHEHGGAATRDDESTTTYLPIAEGICVPYAIGGGLDTVTRFLNEDFSRTSASVVNVSAIAWRVHDQLSLGEDVWPAEWIRQPTSPVGTR